MNTNDFAIRAENISKVYRLGVKDVTKDTLGATLVDMLKSPLKNFRKYRSLYTFDDVIQNEDDRYRDTEDILWALKGISFDIKEGEVVGIIGKNGAGKSTLLKILSRITAPTTGKIEIQGRVSSLLEVGTGFHPELTGRENVYLNGTVLGMKKTEIDRKFDEIVTFSGVEKFLDTPVKRYSSGMRVRLAFAVAAHLEPEILIIDEVLAVGDAAFQKKCLNKMENVGKEGRTVIFVSHSMPAITRMCERVILLDEGRIVHDSTPRDVVGLYLKGENKNTAQREWNNINDTPGGEVVRLRSARIKSKDNETTDTYDIRLPIGIEMEYEVIKDGYVLMPTFSLFDEEGARICVAIDQDKTWRKRPRPCGKYTSTAWIPGNLLGEGMFTINIVIWTLKPVKNLEFVERDVIAFQVVDSMGGDSARADWEGDLKGGIRPILEWTTTSDTQADENMDRIAKIVK